MRVLLLLCLALTACGGGGGSSDNGAGPPPPPPPPPCCASTASIAADFDSAEQTALADYDGRSNNVGCCDGAHLETMRNNAILAADEWAASAYGIVDGYAQTEELDGPAIADLVEDYRASILNYVLADYDEYSGSPAWDGNEAFVQQTRQEAVDGVNAEFDALQVALADAGYT